MATSVLVIGGGGREHAIVRQLAASPLRPRLFAAPGNPGIAELADNVALDVRDQAAVVRFCQNEGVELVVVGPEEPLIAGLADQLRHGGIAVFGPGAMGARLEGDKEFAKEVLRTAGVPTPHAHAFSSSESALDHLDTMELPVVVKACGIAQGKGVAVCPTREEAAAFIRECLDGQRFGGAGLRILLEECVFGPELSVLIVTDGQDYALLAPSRDHKRIGEGDTGPNTGGMGAFAPVALPPLLRAEIDTRVVLPVLAELRRRDIPYRGVLYAGLMLTVTGPQVLEFNCRFGDPETQVVLPLLRCDLLELCTAVAAGELGTFLQQYPPAESDPTDWTGAGLSEWQRHAVVVVGAADGYPGRCLTGKAVELPADGDDAWIVHAGTRRAGGDLVTAGGRVLGAVGCAPRLDAARERAYELLGRAHFEGLTYRRDIAARKD
jgi:phosphoribosylamine---glycine ligase